MILVCTVIGTFRIRHRSKYILPISREISQKKKSEKKYFLTSSIDVKILLSQVFPETRGRSNYGTFVG